MLFAVVPGRSIACAFAADARYFAATGEPTAVSAAVSGASFFPARSGGQVGGEACAR